MKTYIAILVGVVALFGVVFIGYNYTDIIKKETPKQVINDNVQRVTGEVKRFFEGDNVLSYAFDTSSDATTTAQMEGALIRVVRQDGTLRAALYFSYEGGRGYSPTDYIVEVIAPKVSMLTQTGTTTVGAYDWSTAESASSEWFVARVRDGEWLVVVEGAKASHEETISILETFSVK